MLAITTELAARLEHAEALDAADCAEAEAQLHPETGAAVRAVAGGVLAFVGADSPLTHALGLGMSGPVTAEQLDEVEEFFRSRGAQVTLDVCPCADHTLVELVAARGYRITEFSHVMVRAIAPGESVASDSGGEIETRVAQSHERELWARTVVAGFFGRDAVTDEEFRTGRVLFDMANAIALFASVGGEPAGCAAVSLRSGIASCFADSTLVRFRRRGVHRALIAARVRIAAQRGCEFITAGTQPGSGSQRDYERLGFQVAYTKVTMTL
ncbi:MAG TPA: GNAT family N-acetyltransferase [Bryobacteraceae bacterium]|nr:GNAT family N-acetyltransferase [Bryobacteraceae bacterium]